MLINDDCLNCMEKIQKESIDMIYLDPPFFSQKKQSLSDKNGFTYSFDDIWQSMDEYISYIFDRLTILKETLKDSGSIFLHCNTSASHYLKLTMDKIFGIKNFRSEIIWTYKRWSNSKNGLLNSHQTILYYSKTDEYQFNKIYSDYSLSTNIDQILQDRIRNNLGKSIYKIDYYNNIVISGEKKGVPLSDVWEIPFLNPKAKERTGYPTQKPIALLEKIIEISTNENDFILDPFCGSGTALIAAKLMNRNYIGIDINKNAIEMSKSRLENPIKSESILLKKGINTFNNKTDMERGILNSLDCHIVQRNKGIDAFLKKHYLGFPVAIKVQKEHENFDEAVKLLINAGNKKQCSFLVLIRTNKTGGFIEPYIPNNMIVIDSYSLSISNCLDTKINKELANS